VRSRADIEQSAGATRGGAVLEQACRAVAAGEDVVGRGVKNRVHQRGFAGSVVASEGRDRRRRLARVPQTDRAIKARREELVLVGGRETDTGGNERVLVSKRDGRCVVGPRSRIQHTDQSIVARGRKDVCVAQHLLPSGALDHALTKRKENK